MASRVLTAAVGAPAILVPALLGGWFWLAAVLALHLLAAAEAGQIGRLLGARVPQAALYLAAFFFEFGSFFGGERGFLFAALAVLALMLGHAVVCYPHYGAGDVAVALSLSAYLSLFGYLVLLRTAYDWPLTLAALCVTWANDTAAYFLGTLAGRRPLAPALSPKKTWEGTAAGVTAAAAVGIFWAYWLDRAWVPWLVVALLGAVAGQVGDLWESALKRQAGLKDAGRLLPGHGGILDRFDSLLFVAPLFFYFGRWLG